MPAQKKAKKSPTRRRKPRPQDAGALATISALKSVKVPAAKKQQFAKKLQQIQPKLTRYWEKLILNTIQQHQQEVEAMIQAPDSESVVDLVAKVGFCSGARGSTKDECVGNGGQWNGMPIPPHIIDMIRDFGIPGP